ncbi:PhzF family phenazine biosynthesis protein [Saccharopolyspora erythraea NRRL 2338]|uniref:Phenazine biosynthesis PhzC/PhzF protein n=2 Tax=Saccharopolyspora erythraea TaxID=1836 RepID=A4F798_SACEN|nr:PhzF family phenazine biosynthesis protein [Saccharopolyspora erythraea]EQD86341.1 isomerase [Saccharopolyspora erythraea D]PFG93725.1 PhzF family phenazine biosynthesis protein [Saccharopolyspora erythraea NRRL 2338]QRK90563.1 PhzF family phenazine biosynthesis protein [Saccharopolyspora erythraea]CAL99922.1 phenazine biosynthesis PhzC/PhzF protein [Saccharopolyspora erythraea NRRL 2338]
MRAYVVDSFTDRAFSGNPAGVVLLDAPADAAWMQSVAAELKHSETAFVVVGGDAPAKPLRWFTPDTEVPLCGHATLATAHVLGGDQLFDTASGELRCTAGEDGWIEMDFPVDVPEPVEPPEELTAGLPGITIEQVAEGATKLLVRAASAAEVRALHPDFDALVQVPKPGVVVTAPGDHDGVDFVSRVFAPRVGIPEDPVTGSAHCTLAAWWSTRLDRTGHGAEFVGEQASARGGTVRMTLRGDRVGLRGRAVTVLEGELLA